MKMRLPLKDRENRRVPNHCNFNVLILEIKHKRSQKQGLQSGKTGGKLEIMVQSTAATAAEVVAVVGHKKCFSDLLRFRPFPLSLSLFLCAPVATRAPLSPLELLLPFYLPFTLPSFASNSNNASERRVN